MGLFAKIFSTDDAISKTVDAVASGLDKLVYTNEERADAAAIDRAAARAMVVDWMTATNGQNLARRWIAFAITSMWLAQYAMANLFSVLAVFMQDTRANMFLGASTVMANYAVQMNGAVMLILAFYFAAPHMDKVVDVAMSRFAGGVPK